MNVGLERFSDFSHRMAVTSYGSVADAGDLSDLESARGAMVDHNNTDDGRSEVKRVTCYMTVYNGNNFSCF